MSTRTKAQARNWLANGVLAASSLIAALLITETALRAVGFSDPVLWTYDDIAGTKLRAGAKGWQRREGEAFITVNSDGLRDREHSRNKPPNTIRLAVLGASMAEALQVPVEKTFWAIAEQELKNCKAFGASEVEAINFGVSGYGTAQELLTFRHRAIAYSPDITILAMTPAHDVRNNSKALEPLKLTPFFSVVNGELTVDNGFLRNPEYLEFRSNAEARQFLFDLRIFQLLRRLKLVWQQREAAAARSERADAIDIGPDGSGLVPPPSQAWRDAWGITERLIAALRDDVAAAGGRFLLLTIPVGIQVNPNHEIRDRLARDLKVKDLWYPETRVRDFADRENIDAVLLGQLFLAQTEKNRTYLHGFKNAQLGSGHLNEAGHRLIGEALAAQLCQPR